MRTPWFMLLAGDILAQRLVRAVGRYQFENAVDLLRQLAAKLGITLD